MDWSVEDCVQHIYQSLQQNQATELEANENTTSHLAAETQLERGSGEMPTTKTTIHNVHHESFRENSGRSHSPTVSVELGPASTGALITTGLVDTILLSVYDCAHLTDAHRGASVLPALHYQHDTLLSHGYELVHTSPTFFTDSCLPLETLSHSSAPAPQAAPPKVSCAAPAFEEGAWRFQRWQRTLQ